MIITILIVLVMIIVPTIMYITNKWDSLENLVFDLIIGIIGLIFFSTSFLYSGTTYFQDEHYELSEKQSIVALQDNVNAKDNISFLGCGPVGKKLCYFYAEKTDNGIKINKIYSDTCFIEYSNKPHIETYELKKFNHFSRYFYAWPFCVYYKVYVPEGTIQQNYNIDLQ